MATINDHYLKLKAGYLFPEIARRVNAFAEANPEAPIIRLGIGDVTEPLPEVCRTAMIQAVEEMGDRATFKGYGPEQGYAWLREKIAAQDFRPEAVKSMPRRSLSQTGPSATPAISSTFLAKATPLPSLTRSIPSM